MKNTEQLKLIEGVFQHEECKEILTSIFSAKINFHQMKNFSSQERFGTDDESASKRIPALREEMMKLDRILAEAKAKNQRLNISAQVNISMSEV